MASIQFIKITTSQCTQIIPNKFKILKENSFDINSNTVILYSKLKPCVLGFIIFIIYIQIPHILPIL